MDTAELLALGVSTNVPNACRAMGIGTSTGYAMAAQDRFPIRIHRVGRRLIVPTRALVEFLGLAVDESVA